jgi:endogenous inhibitor of DNA gyrase (YacG/DUF329 family)
MADRLRRVYIVCPACGKRFSYSQSDYKKRLKRLKMVKELSCSKRCAQVNQKKYRASEWSFEKAANGWI